VIKTTERVKQTGEVFTPDWLVEEMLDKLPEELFTDHSKTFIDPACGDGNFLIQVLDRKIKKGSSAIEALSTTYGVDIMQDNVNDCRKRLFLRAVEEDKTSIKAMVKILKSNIICGNALETPLEELFKEQTTYINESPIRKLA
jgi:type I restriction-modification system DNA methylase subunit